MYWSPDESLLTTLEDCGILKVCTLCNYHYVSAKKSFFFFFFFFFSICFYNIMLCIYSYGISGVKYLHWHIHSMPTLQTLSHGIQKLVKKVICY